MSDESGDVDPTPRRKRRPKGKIVVGAGAPKKTARERRDARRARVAKTPTPVRAPSVRTLRQQHPPRGQGIIKLAAFALLILGGVIFLANLGQAQRHSTDPNATAPPTSEPLFSFLPFPTLGVSTPVPSWTPLPTPVPVPDIALIAGHWAKESDNGVPAVRDSGAVCPDGLREVDITKGVTDLMIPMLQRRGYRVVQLEEFDARLKKVEPDFAPKVLLSVHADSCLSGPEYPYASGYKIAHAEPSQNDREDGRLVTCLTRAYDKVVSKYDLVFNQNTITRNMTEYHAFREVVETTPAAIIELGFLGNDRAVLVGHQDELARGLAIGLDDFLKRQPCAPTPTPAPTEEIKP